MKQSRLADSEKEIAELFSSLEDDAPTHGLEAKILTSLERLERLEDGSGASPLRRSTLLKNWLLAGGILVIGAVGLVALGERDAPLDTRHVTLGPTSMTASPSTNASTPSEPDPEGDLQPFVPSFAVEDLPTASSRPSPQGASRRTMEADVKDSFREQLALVESARHALAEGRSGECLEMLRRYDATYPAGLFAMEVRIVRIEALIAAKQSERAASLARELLASDPNGSYATRLRAILSQMDALDR